MREICTSGSMSGEWKRSMAELVRHRQTKEPVTDRPRLNHRATPRLYLDEPGFHASPKRQREESAWIAADSGDHGGKKRDEATSKGGTTALIAPTLSDPHAPAALWIRWVLRPAPPS